MHKQKKQISFKPDNEINIVYPIITRNELNLVKSDLWWTFYEMECMKKKAFNEYYKFIRSNPFVDFKNALNLMYENDENEVNESNINESNISETNINESNISELNISETNINESNINESNISETNVNLGIKLTKSFNNLQILNEEKSDLRLVDLTDGIFNVNLNNNTTNNHTINNHTINNHTINNHTTNNHTTNNIMNIHLMNFNANIYTYDTEYLFPLK